MSTRARTVALLLALGAAGSLSVRAQDAGLAPLARPSVGMRARLEGVLLPGPRLAPRPLTPEAPIVLRVLSCSPAEGGGFRYALEVYGLEPGRHDLTAWLQPEDPTAAAVALPPVPIEVLTVLPPGAAEPAALDPVPPPRLGGYRLLLGLAIAAWVAGLLGLLLSGRARRRALRAQAAPPPPPPSAAELLRPLVRQALANQLDPSGQAALEALVLAACREQLGLRDLPAREVMARLRADPEAGPIVSALETFFHAPPERARPALEAALGSFAHERGGA